MYMNVKQKYNTRQLCNNSRATICHLFSQCDKAVELWNNITHWVTHQTSIYLELPDTTEILLYITYDRS